MPRSTDGDGEVRFERWLIETGKRSTSVGSLRWAESSSAVLMGMYLELCARSHSITVFRAIESMQLIVDSAVKREMQPSFARLERRINRLEARFDRARCTRIG